MARIFLTALASFATGHAVDFGTEGGMGMLQVNATVHTDQSSDSIMGPHVLVMGETALRERFDNETIQEFLRKGIIQKQDSNSTQDEPNATPEEPQYFVHNYRAKKMLARRKLMAIAKQASNWARKAWRKVMSTDNGRRGALGKLQAAADNVSSVAQKAFADATKEIQNDNGWKAFKEHPPNKHAGDEGAAEAEQHPAEADGSTTVKRHVKSN